MKKRQGCSLKEDAAQLAATNSFSKSAEGICRSAKARGLQRCRISSGTPSMAGACFSFSISSGAFSDTGHSSSLDQHYSGLDAVRRTTTQELRRNRDPLKIPAPLEY